MHTLPDTNVRKFETFPRANDVTPKRDPRRAPSVTIDDVPEDLRSVAGIVRDRAQETFFGRHYPEPNFKIGKLNQTYHKEIEATPGKVGETYRILGEKYGDLLARVNARAF